jgi:hypothetical protein
MQTLKVIQTIRWIDAIIPAEAKAILFRQPDLEESDADKENSIHQHIVAIQSLGNAFGQISRNSEAVEVLKAFNLGSLMDQSFISDMLSKLFSNPDESNDIPGEFKEITSFYNLMTDTASSWESLTIPEDLRNVEFPEDIITLIICSSKPAPVAVLSKAAGLLADIYEAIAVAYCKKIKAPLKILKLEGCTNLRVDCQGVEEIIKLMKAFIQEAWCKVRHKRAEEVIENNKAVISSLAVISYINTRESLRELSREEAETLRRRIINDALGLFQCGGLIGEISIKENIDNALLLSGFSPKLLPLPEKSSKSKPTSKRTQKSRQSGRKKRSGRK